MRTLLFSCMIALVILPSFLELKKKKLKLPEAFVVIPGGTFSFPDHLSDYYQADSGHSMKRISLDGFYISRYEISNQQYRQFYNEVSMGMTEAERLKIVCDTTGWARMNTGNAPMQKYYYNHPSYKNYPVVNISYEGAETYCEWLQQTLQKENPDFEIEVRLPTKAQWIWAAMGGRSQAMFPWGNYYLRNRKGEPMCNFRKVSDQAIYRNRKTGKPEVSDAGQVSVAMYTSAVKSFYPNDYGLYNMCGNAAEMIYEKGVSMGGSWNDYGGDVHIRAEKYYQNPDPETGFRPVIIVKEKSK